MDRRVMYRETLFVLAGSLVLSLVMELIFLLLGRWRPAVLYGNLLTVAATTLNYYLMCRALLRAVASGGDENNVKARMKASASGRLLLLGLIVAAGCYASVKWNAVDLWATLIPLLFVRITLFVRSRMIARETPAPADPPPAGEAHAPDTTAAAEDRGNTAPAGNAVENAAAPKAGETLPTDGAPAVSDTTEQLRAETTPAAAPFRTDRHGRPVPPSLSELLKGGETDDE